LLALLSGTVVSSVLAARARQQAGKAELAARRASEEAGRANRLAVDLKASLDPSNRLAGDLQVSLREAEPRPPALNFQRGQAACERGEIGPGLLWLVESWRSAVAAGEADWQHTARAGIAAWWRHHGDLRAVLWHAQSAQVQGAGFSSDGRAVITGSGRDSG